LPFNHADIGSFSLLDTANRHIENGIDDLAHL